MSDYHTTPTKPEVWTAIKLAHPELVVFGSYSAPDGEHGSDRGVMFTSYGFNNCDFPIMEARTEWDIDRSDPATRINEQHKYWLCCPRSE